MRGSGLKVIFPFFRKSLPDCQATPQVRPGKVLALPPLGSGARFG